LGRALDRAFANQVDSSEAWRELTVSCSGLGAAVRLGVFGRL
jgi:hypothetical protein